MGLSSMEHKPM